MLDNSKGIRVRKSSFQIIGIQVLKDIFSGEI